ncbi:MAG: PEGA domain-containing protein, partial [Myxococcales bacterium]|nr:PEGA domain-containing protein [Myxococcales bacterium]
APEAPSAPAPEVASARSGMITFRTEPPGASVRIGDREVPGVTPTALGEHPVGEHTVELQLDGHVAWAGRVVLREGEPETVEATLRPLPRVAERSTGGSMRPSTPREPPREVREPTERAASASTGRVSINTRPWSKVYVGERLLGTTPIGNVEVPAGTLRLRIVDRDGAEHERTVRVGADADERVFYDLSGER